jgi:hypothetical protein
MTDEANELSKHKLARLTRDCLSLGLFDVDEPKADEGHQAHG